MADPRRAVLNDDSDITGARVVIVEARFYDDLQDALLAGAKAQLDAAGVRILRIENHRVSQSIYLADPDGNEIELYVDDDPRIWRDNPAAVASVQPLEL